MTVSGVERFCQYVQELEESAGKIEVFTRVGQYHASAYDCQCYIESDEFDEDTFVIFGDDETAMISIDSIESMVVMKLSNT